MMDEVVVRDDTSWMGLRRFHAIRACGGEEEAARWAAGVIERVIGEGELVGSLVYEEEGLGLWHVRVYWRDGNGLVIDLPNQEGGER